MKKTLIATTLVCLAGLTVGATALREAAPTPGEAGLERLASYAGDWYGVGEDGKPTDELVSSVRVTAGGHTVLETHWPGQPHEMVTLYYLEDDALMLVHYCMLGNQPKMRAASMTDDELSFECVGMKDEQQSHMHSASIKSLGENHHNLSWTNREKGEEVEAVVFDVIRK